MTIRDVEKVVISVLRAAGAMAVDLFRLSAWFVANAGAWKADELLGFRLRRGTVAGLLGRFITGLAMQAGMAIANKTSAPTMSKYGLDVAVDRVQGFLKTQAARLQGIPVAGTFTIENVMTLDSLPRNGWRIS